MYPQLQTFCKFRSLAESLRALLFLLSWCLYLRERSHVPETAASPGPGAGPEFCEEMRKGCGPNPREGPLLLYRVQRGGYCIALVQLLELLCIINATWPTCPVEGEDVSVTLGGALGGVGLRTAAGETTGLSPGGAGVFRRHLQLWTRVKGEGSGL